MGCFHLSAMVDPISCLGYWLTLLNTFVKPYGTVQ